MIGLISVVDRYGPAIEWDLRALWQVDIHEYFRGERPWRQLRRFIDGLPPTSHYVIAKQNDPVIALEAARQIRERRAAGKGGKYRPPAVEWDTHAELLASILDRQGEILAVLIDQPIAGKRRKAKPPRPTARPESAIERAEQLLSEEHVNEIMADVEAGYVSEEEYARIAAEVEAQRAEAERQAAVTSPEGPGD